MDSQATFATDQNIKNAFKGYTQEMQMCIQNCTLAHQICEQTLSYCLTKDGMHFEPQHLKALIDCAQICTVSADFMSRDSKIHSSVCGVCAEACRACAASCDQFPDDEAMKLCADVSRQCEETCRQMAKMNH